VSEAFPVRDVWHLPTRRLGRTVTVYHEVDSTNSRASAAALQADGDGLAFLADRQSAGRGQYGRSWLAPARSSVLLSLLLRPEPHLSRPVVLTAWAAVAVCAVVEQKTGVRPRIKWPNDVLVRDKKVCGILIEQGVRGDQTASVVGIGLNVTQSQEDFLAAELPDATSLRLLAGGAPDTDDVARSLITQLDEEYDRICRGDRESLQMRWAALLGLLGEEVVAQCADARHRGRLSAASFAGLTLERPGRTALVLAPEVILHLDRA
jgi:BirA family transcriptional regulator, biotin operon repressor / biotin---[acetyl-CoA-carboxylase] ligase